MFRNIEDYRAHLFATLQRLDRLAQISVDIIT